MSRTLRSIGLASLLILALSAASSIRGADETPPVPGAGEAAKEQTPADSFAKTVITATRILGESHIKKLSQGEMVRWAIANVYRRSDKRIPHKIAGRLKRIGNLTEAERSALLVEVYKNLEQRKQPKRKRRVDLALEGIISRLEPQARYVAGDDGCDCIRWAYWPTGVGLRLDKDAGSGRLRVVTPLKGGPAYKAGIRAGDLILEITQKPDVEGADEQVPEPFSASTRGLTLEKAKDLLIGKPDSRVVLTVQRPGVRGRRIVELVRKGVGEETVFGVRRTANDGWDFLADPGRKIAYVRLARFDAWTTNDLARALAGLNKSGIKGLILDLRFNSGGLIASAAEVAELFIVDGMLFTFRSRRMEEAVTCRRNRENKYLVFPTVCLVNGTTAKASELLAACLQDHGRAVIVGDRTCGDTGLQNIHRIEGAGQITFTAALMCRSNGKNLARCMTAGREDEVWGVVPDKGFALKLSPGERKAIQDHHRKQELILPAAQRRQQRRASVKDRQLEMALAYLRGTIK